MPDHWSIKCRIIGQLILPIAEILKIRRPPSDVHDEALVFKDDVASGHSSFEGCSVTRSPTPRLVSRTTVSEKLHEDSLG
jgi:hypothetical protein